MAISPLLPTTIAGAPGTGPVPINTVELRRWLERHRGLKLADYEALRRWSVTDPQALVICNAAKDAYDFLGSPEGELAIAQAVIYMACAPKSNAGYVGYKGAMRAARDTGSLMPPAHIRNAPTKLMEDLGYGAGYEYDHETDGSFSGQNYFPDGMERQTFYEPKGAGREGPIREKLEQWAKLRRERSKE